MQKPTASHHVERVCNLFIFILCVLVFYICLHEDVGSPGTVVIDSCKLPCGCLELNMVSLKGRENLNGMSLLKPSLQNSGTPRKEEVEIV